MVAYQSLKTKEKSSPVIPSLTGAVAYESFLANLLKSLSDISNGISQIRS